MRNKRLDQELLKRIVVEIDQLAVNFHEKHLLDAMPAIFRHPITREKLHNFRLHLLWLERKGIFTSVIRQRRCYTGYELNLSAFKTFKENFESGKLERKKSQRVGYTRKVKENVQDDNSIEIGFEVQENKFMYRQGNRYGVIDSNNQIIIQAEETSVTNLMQDMEKKLKIASINLISEGE
jgi:hypothetical protein